MNYKNNVQSITGNSKHEKEQLVASLLVSAFVLRLTNQVSQSFSLIDDAIEFADEAKLDKATIKSIAFNRVEVLKEVLRGTVYN